MRQEKRFDVGDVTMWLYKDSDKNGKLISQEAKFRLHKYDYTEEGWHKIAKDATLSFNDGELLCHVSTKDRLEGIKKNGLIPCVGETYRGYWDRSKGCEEYVNELQPGVFLKRDKKRFRASYRKPIYLYINPNLLDKEYLYVDYAWRNGESLFYAKPIPPECIIFP